jgi:prepilin-type N-terminal cleavage/methylation domain-containing protein
MGRRGMTLVELLVVIVIILILASLLVVLVSNVTDRARYEDTKIRVKALAQGCENYRVDFQSYPPAGTSANLHDQLGREQTLTVGGVQMRRGPYVVFPTNWLQGNPASPDPFPPRVVVDAWDRPIEYYPTPALLILSVGKDSSDNTDDVRSDRAEN